LKFYDVVFSIDDFLEIVERKNGDLSDCRICVNYKTVGEPFVRVSVILSIRLGDRVLKCIVARRNFNGYFIFDEKSRENAEYRKWLEDVYKMVEGKLGFKPIEGYWR